MKLQEKVAIITGASRGIGRAIALGYASEGAKLILVARNGSRVEEVACGIRRSGGECIAVQGDVGEPHDVERVVVRCIEAYRGVDILVNNAAILGPVGPFHTNDFRSWSDTIRINLTGLALFCHAVLPEMISRGAGKIINLSGAGVARPSPTLSAYGASKAAVVRLTEMLGMELREHGIEINALGPGQIDTSLLDPITEAGESVVEPSFVSQVRRTKTGHGASIEKAVELAVWLASADSNGLTGKLVSAVSDKGSHMTQCIPEIMSSDSRTLRVVT